MSKKNKKYDKVAINNTELVPTTIGELSEKEGGVGFVIIFFVTLACIVFFLPQINQWYLSVTGKAPAVSPVVDDDETIIEPTEPGDSGNDYIDLSTTTTYTKDNITYTFNLVKNTKVLSVGISKTSSVSDTYFESNPVYIELYTADKELSQRIKISKEEISSNSVTYEYDLTTAYKYGDVAYIVINKMMTDDYPLVELNEDEDTKKANMVCSKGLESLTYIFNKVDSDYKLISINDMIQINNASTEQIATYEELKNNYLAVDGIEADIIQASDGVTFEAEIDLNKVVLRTKKRLLNNPAFYEKDTEARIIAFELEAQDYTCEIN